MSYGLKHSVTPKRTPKRTPSLLYLVLRRLCLVSENYQNLPRITSEAELLPSLRERLKLDQWIHAAKLNLYYLYCALH